MSFFSSIVKQVVEVRDRANHEREIDDWFKTIKYEQKVDLYNKIRSFKK